MTFTRRQLLTMAAGAAGFARLGRSAENQPGLIINSARPKDYEMALAGFKDWITPEEHFFVRCHHYVPDVKLSDWSLKIDGMVNTPVTLSLDDLKKLPRVSHVAVLECAGNGRAFYEPHVPGMQWKYGGVANGKWAGVRLVDVLQKAGVKSAATEVLFDGEDVAIGKMPKFQRTVPLPKATHPDTILAFELNGRPIPMDHGFPVRLVVPGWAGDSWVKWVKHIEVLDHEFDGFWMKTAYRHPLKPVPPGTAVPPEQMVPVSDLALKSVIATPVGDWMAPGRTKISGTAWANGTAVAGVDVSTDGGKSWQAAKLGPDESKYAWRLWEMDWRPAEGSYTVLARARDAAGNMQPLEQQWNPSGYLWNVSAPLQVTVSRQQASQPGGSKPASEHPAGYQAACLTCHEEDVIRMQHLTAAQWDKEWNKMVGWGAEAKPEYKDGILNYLKANFKQ